MSSHSSVSLCTLLQCFLSCWLLSGAPSQALCRAAVKRHSCRCIQEHNKAVQVVLRLDAWVLPEAASTRITAGMPCKTLLPTNQLTWGACPLCLVATQGGCAGSCVHNRSHAAAARCSTCTSAAGKDWSNCNKHNACKHHGYEHTNLLPVQAKQIETQILLRRLCVSFRAISQAPACEADQALTSSPPSRCLKLTLVSCLWPSDLYCCLMPRPPAAPRPVTQGTQPRGRAHLDLCSV